MEKTKMKLYMLNTRGTCCSVRANVLLYHLIHYYYIMSYYHGLLFSIVPSITECYMFELYVKWR